MYELISYFCIKKIWGKVPFIEQIQMQREHLLYLVGETRNWQIFERVETR